MLGVNTMCDFNSKLTRWTPTFDKNNNTFYNQALNTVFNYGTRTLSSLYTSWIFDLKELSFSQRENKVKTVDARIIADDCDLWLTDPPYADAVNYQELTEYFLAWDVKILQKLFPDWYTDSKRVLAVRGTGESFNRSMVEIYRRLAQHMPDDGMQVVMFTHQDPAVWADLTYTLMAAGLQVSAAWNVATETEAGGLKEGNYVKGTVLLILHKKNTEATGYTDEIMNEVEFEVRSQIDSMRSLDDQEDPNFTDADYILAAYAASLKVLTSYKTIGGVNLDYELSKPRSGGQSSPVENIIEQAIGIAHNYLIPPSFDAFIWKSLTADERFYIKGIELEKNGVRQIAAYQELGRGFGVRDYKNLLASTKANEVRLKSAMEFADRNLRVTEPFSNTLLRHCLMALYQAQKEQDANAGKNWLRNEVEDYWNQRSKLGILLKYLATTASIAGMAHRREEAEYAQFVAELVKNDLL